MVSVADGSSSQRPGFNGTISKDNRSESPSMVGAAKSLLSGLHPLRVDDARDPWAYVARNRAGRRAGGFPGTSPSSATGGGTVCDHMAAPIVPYYPQPSATWRRTPGPSP